MQFVAARFTTPSDADYNYQLSTQKNHTVDKPEFSGPHAAIRAKLDHKYHGFYGSERQRIQDDIIEDVIRGGTAHTNQEDGPWVVFTAGAMGAGKGYTISWMSQQGHFPLPDLVQIDPDAFKTSFPEWKRYVQKDRLTAGVHTRRESGYMVEIAQHAAMDAKKNVWVDGSLRDGEWYSQVFDDIRARWPAYRIAILYVYADVDVIFERARKRAEETGREVPKSELMDSINRVPHSVDFLRKKADFTAYISNNDAGPQLQKTCTFDSETINESGSWAAVSERFNTAPGLVRRRKPLVQMCLKTLIQKLSLIHI
eukprot:TRINITY_DN13396_c0_g1_i2.p1 TRINITY_DN13396_c0_g1~~TRINITY_DN13396_c0_g1_i2.p1  ORF type:complete len:312 (-),score=67.94 TRINITY_DN13396_c0_g1_i2:148-1083(-)